MLYMVTSVWRGKLHLDNMRLFEDESLARAYADVLAEDEKVRIYEMHSDSKPKMIYQTDW